MVAEIVSLATAAVPGASLVSNLIADKIADFLTWEYSEPVKASENMYDVTATVSTQATLDIPLAGEKTYGASLPFNLRVDVDRSAVTEWSADLGGGSIGEIEPTP